MTTHDQSRRIYTIHLTSLHQPFEYQGYSFLSQIGQYYAVTINKRKTRLYTLVNFLQQKNVRLLEKISGGKTKIVER